MAAKISGARIREVRAEDRQDADGGSTVHRDFFVVRDGHEYAGSHLLVEMWGARNLSDAATVEAALTEATRDAGATLLQLFVHHFGPNCGVTGVAVLAESHISIHTWPERGYAAVDIFMCGGCDPYAAVPALERAFAPQRVSLDEHKRGLMP